MYTSLIRDTHTDVRNSGCKSAIKVSRISFNFTGELCLMAYTSESRDCRAQSGKKKVDSTRSLIRGSQSSSRWLWARDAVAPDPAKRTLCFPTTIIRRRRRQTRSLASSANSSSLKARRPGFSYLRNACPSSSSPSPPPPPPPLLSVVSLSLRFSFTPLASPVVFPPWPADAFSPLSPPQTPRFCRLRGDHVAGR